MDKYTTFRLDFAPHLGFPTPDVPLFGALNGDATPEAQIAFAAAQGFRRVQDPFTAQRSEEAQCRIGQTAKSIGVGLGCFIYAPLERAFQPVWSAADPETRQALDTDIEAAIAIGRRIGSRHIAVLTGSDTTRGRAEQLHAMTANLVRVADRVAEAGMILAWRRSTVNACRRCCCIILSMRLTLTAFLAASMGASLCHG